MRSNNAGWGNSHDMKSTSTPHVVLGSSVTLRVVVAGPLEVVVVVYGPLRLEVRLVCGLLSTEWSSGLGEDSRICRALLPYMSRLTAANAELTVKPSLLLRSEIVHPVHLHGEELHVAEVTVSREVVFRRKSGSGAVSAHSLKVIFLLEGLNIVEFYSGK
jgi:hypothetical protein